jgi:hypothetical protein
MLLLNFLYRFETERDGSYLAFLRFISFPNIRFISLRRETSETIPSVSLLSEMAFAPVSLTFASTEKKGRTEKQTISKYFLRSLFKIPDVRWRHVSGMIIGMEPTVVCNNVIVNNQRWAFR